MNIPRSAIVSGLALAALTLAPARPAHAQDFTFTVSNSPLVLAPGASGSFMGTVTYLVPRAASTNLSVFVASGFAGAAFTSIGVDPAFQAFRFNTAATTYTGAILTVTLAPASTPGATFSGTIGLQDMNSPAPTTVPVTLTVASPVPEASTVASFGLLLALGAGGLVITVRRKRADKKAAPSL